MFNVYVKDLESDNILSKLSEIIEENNSIHATS